MFEMAQSNGHNYCECRHFYSAIKKYSWDAFIPEVLETVETLDEANEREAYYIALYNSTDDRFGYNIKPGGDNSIMADESKRIISEKAKARYSSGIPNPMQGRRHSDSAIQKQREKKVGARNPMYGSKWSDKQRKLSGTRGKTLSLSDERRLELREHMRHIGKTVGLRRVICVEDEAVFQSVSLAASAYGVSKSTLCGHLNGNQHTCKGKHFEYMD